MAVPEINQESIAQLDKELEESYQENKDWRAVCRRLKESGGKTSDGFDRIHIGRAVMEEHMRRQEEIQMLEARLESMDAYESILAREGYPEDTPFETLPAYLSGQMPAGYGTLDDMRDEIRLDIEGRTEAVTQFYEDVYNNKAYIDPEVRMDLGGGYEEYESQRNSERIHEITDRAIQASGGFGIDYSRSKDMTKEAVKEKQASISKPEPAAQRPFADKSVSFDDYDFGMSDDDVGLR